MRIPPGQQLSRPDGGLSTYIRVVLQGLDLFRGESAGEALEPRDVIDVVSISGHRCHRPVDRIGGDILVQLDNVFALDQIVARAARDVERCRRSSL